MMIRYSRMFACASVCALALSGCTIFPASEPPRVMDFTPTVTDLARADKQQPYSLRVDTPMASEPVYSSRILAKPESTEIRIYGGVRWRDTAPIIMRDMLTAALRSNQGFKRVITDVSPAESDLTLLTELLRFHSQPDNGQTKVIITLYSEILENRSRKTACARTFDVTSIAASANIEDVIKAFNNAGKRLAEELTHWASTCDGLPAAD